MAGTRTAPLDAVRDIATVLVVGKIEVGVRERAEVAPAFREVQWLRY